MKESMWGYAIVVFGVAIIAFMLLVQNMTSTSEEDFYLTREVLEASMYDAIDYGTYAKSGKLVMSEAKFVEVFLRRFADSVNNSKDYTINFYDIHEYPPKATVVVKTNTGTETVASDDVNVNILTYLNAIMETTYSYNEEREVCAQTSDTTKECDEAGTEAYVVNASSPYNLDSGTQTLNNGKKLYLTFRFLADNDSCGYYIAGVDSKTRYMSKSDDADYYDKLTEYCYVRDSSNVNYFVKKADLITPK